MLAGGATVARDLPIPGRELGRHPPGHGVPAAVQPGAAGRPATSPISAAGKRVVIIGGGDTGADCLGTAHRQGAASVHQFEIMPRPPDQRDRVTPWPLWPLMLRTSSAHEEGGERVFSVNTVEFVGDGDGRVAGLGPTRWRADRRRAAQLREGRGHRLRAAVRAGAAGHGLHRAASRRRCSTLGVSLTDRGNVGRDADWATNVDGVFVCGDMGRGQSLIVWAIAEGRSCAAAVDSWLMGETLLPAPLDP